MTSFPSCCLWIHDIFRSQLSDHVTHPQRPLFLPVSLPIYQTPPPDTHISVGSQVALPGGVKAVIRAHCVVSEELFLVGTVCSAHCKIKKNNNINNSGKNK